MNEKTTICFVLTGVKYSQSDLGKHYKTFCGLYVPRPGCQICQDPGVIQCPSVSPCFLSAFRCFLSARMRIYYNVSLLPDFPSSLKNMFFNTFVNQRFIKMFKRNAKKSPDIFGLYAIKSYFCTRFRERKQRCFDILTGTA